MEKSDVIKSVQKILAILFIVVICGIVIGILSHNSTMAYTDGEICSICQTTTIRWTYNSQVHGYYCDYCADWYGESSHNNVPADYIKTEFYMTHTTYYVCIEEGCEYKTEVTEDCELVNYTKIDSEKHEAQCKNCRDIYELSHVDKDKNGKCDDCNAILSSSTEKCDACTSYTEVYRKKDDILHSCYRVCTVCAHEWYDADYIHNYTKYTDQKNGTHIAYCNQKCGQSMVEKHEYVNGVCTECKASCSHSYESGKCTQCGQENPDEEIEINSTKYNVNGGYILKVQPSTKVSNFKSSIQTNATEINVYNNNKILSSSEQIGTGMKLELKKGSKILTYTIIVSGDVNGDGESDFKDLAKINKTRLRKMTLAEMYYSAADVNQDGELDLKDLVKINRFRLCKIFEL